MTGREDSTYDDLLAEARGSLRGHDLEAAERVARDALRRAPERGGAYNVLALVRLLRGHLAEGKAMLRAGLAVDPGCRELQVNLPRVGRIGTGPLLVGDEMRPHPYRS
jgi:hypothetical protein